MTRLRIVSLVLAALVLLTAFGGAAMARGSALGTMFVVNCANWVTLRSYASTNAPAVARVPLGAAVDAYYYNSQFTECYYSGLHGYILSTYLSNGSSGSTSSSSSGYLGKKTIVNCNEFVTLRSYASTSAPTVTKVARGQQVDAYYYNSTFSRCFYNGLEGYILNKYLGGSGGASYAPGTYMGTRRVVRCKSYVTLRSYASTSAPAVTTVPLGATVDVYYYNSQFAECYYHNLRGYILMSYLG